MSYRGLFKGYLSDLSKKTSVPGGGSAASLIFSLGVSLMEMAVNFSMDNDNTRVLRKAVASFDKRKKKVLSYVDKDADAFMRVLKSKGKRREEALKKLDKITFDLGLSSVNMLISAGNIKNFVKKNIMSDFDIGIKCVEVALFASVKNMEANNKFFSIKNVKKIDYLKNYLKKR